MRSALPAPALVAGLLLVGTAAALPLPALAASRCTSQVVSGPDACTTFEGGSHEARWPYVRSGHAGVACWQADADPGSPGTSDATVRYACCLDAGQNPHPLWCMESTTRIGTA